MNDQMPMFDDPITPPAEQPPKKPRKPARRVSPKKPMKKAGVKPVEAPVPKRRGRPPGKVKKVRKARVANGHAGGRYSKEQYQAIGLLHAMKQSDRDLVFEIVKGLNS